MGARRRTLEGVRGVAGARGFRGGLGEGRANPGARVEVGRWDTEA